MYYVYIHDVLHTIQFFTEYIKEFNVFLLD